MLAYGDMAGRRLGATRAQHSVPAGTAEPDSFCRGGEEAEFNAGTSDPSASGQSSALGVPMGFLTQGQPKPRQGDKFLAPLISIVSCTICLSLEASNSQGKHRALLKQSNVSCCYVAASSEAELRSPGPSEDVLGPSSDPGSRVVFRRKTN